MKEQSNPIFEYVIYCKNEYLNGATPIDVADSWDQASEKIDAILADPRNANMRMLKDRLFIMEHTRK